MQARRLPARQGTVWFIAGYRVFRTNPPLLTILAFAYLMIFGVMLVLPFGIGGILFPLVQPLLLLAFANACRGVATLGKRGPVPDLLEGSRTEAGKLVQLGSLQLACSLGVMLVMMAIGAKPDPANPESLLRTVGIAAVLSLPLMLAFWFAPLLTGWHGIPPLKSVFFSFVASMRNWRAFLVYGLTLATVALVPSLLAVLAMQVSDLFGQIVAKIVEILLLFLVLPIFLAGSYVSYRDIFAPAAATDD